MGKAQLENGYTRIANKLLEVLAISDVTAQELRVILYIMRMTYGYGKKKALISLKMIAIALKIERRWAGRLTKGLINRQILIPHKIKNARELGINPRFGMWCCRTTGCGTVEPLKCGSAEPHYIDKERKKTYKEKLQGSDDPAFLENLAELKKLVNLTKNLFSGFNLYAFLGRCKQGEVPVPVVCKALRSMTKAEKVTNHWAYLTKIIKVEVPNFHAGESVAKHKDHKKDLESTASVLKDILGGDK